jgi:high-affinity K+ transport system ATPase subunit B
MPLSARRISQQLKMPVLASEATPQDKLNLVKGLQKERKAVAMVKISLAQRKSHTDSVNRLAMA